MKKYYWYRIFKFILKPLFILWYNPKVINKEAIPKEGPIIIAGNHKHVYDQCLCIISTKRILRYMAKKEYFDAALEVLKDKGAIGIFPEGTRNKTKEFLLPFKFGAVSMAQKTGATIVPFGLTGDYKFRSKNLVARFGTPFKVGDMSLEEANQKLYNEIKSLMEENLKSEVK